MDDLLKSLRSEWDILKHGTMSRVPLYHQLYSLFKAAILDGTIPCGVQMPTEQQLAATFEVSRITAKRAMDELANENLIERFRGKGSHVIYQHKPKPVRATVVGTLETLVDVQKDLVVKVLSVEKTVPPADIREIMALAEGERVHKVVRVRSNSDGEPYVHYTSYTKGNVRGLTERNLERRTRTDILRESGVRFARLEQTLGAENASIRIAEELGTEPGAALLEMRRRAMTDSGEVVDVIDGLYNPKRFNYTMVMNLD